jgi:prepilin signal peptidase PulO-like enzyme (type II secretory pathway)
MVIIFLIVLGLCLGSFTNALVWRLHAQETLKDKIADLANKKANAKKAAALRSQLRPLSISKGRSMCPHCKHALAVPDLVPVFSWLSLKGKCRYCHKPIEDTPLPEIGMALLLVASYIWWPFAFNSMGITNFVVWVIALTAFVALVIYDIRWLTLPNVIIYPLIILSAAIAILNVTVFHGGTLGVRDTVFALLIDAGLFYSLFELSKGKWIGGGDVKLGVLIGFLIAQPFQAFLVLFLASVLGTIIILPGLMTKKLNSKSHVPFGPFLIIATVVIKLFGASIVAWYRRKFLLF